VSDTTSQKPPVVLIVTIEQPKVCDEHVCRALVLAARRPSLASAYELLRSTPGVNVFRGGSMLSVHTKPDRDGGKRTRIGLITEE